MRTSTKLVGALAVAGVVAAGSSAFTASNTGVDAANVGYESAVISGVAVTNVAYVVDPGDASKLSQIEFTEAADLTTGHEAILTINGPTTTQIVCDVSVASTITCLTPVDIASVTSIALTVTTV